MKKKIKYTKASLWLKIKRFFQRTFRRKKKHGPVYPDLAKLSAIYGYDEAIRRLSCSKQIHERNRRF